ncbi:uncharacterized protein LOC119021703 [Xyrichtys novacula]|uniref:Uncharacterized protein LOC119021703 n=1 Tax=Xyrichtys novacula TaxID=13765 RepID=A0AAV1GB20_XYRNO|nr:uncharacterized protein LOC119021703 [Xyrichtys novacula]
MYMDAVRTKRLPNPGSSSFDTLEVAQKDPVIMAKLHFYMSIIRTFNPLLTTYQTDQPMMPLHMNDLAELIKLSRANATLSYGSSHGQATVERGFSINKEVETCNMHEETMVTQRLICDYVTVCGGVFKVPITKELLTSAASAMSRYRMYLDEEKQKKMNECATQNQRAAAELIEELKKKKKCLSEVAKVLLDDADQLTTQAEGKAGTLMAQLITKSNTLWK